MVGYGGPLRRAPLPLQFLVPRWRSTADDLVERALELGLSALAVTDHQGLYGAVRFTTAAHEAGLHAVVGMEIELLDRGGAGSRRRSCVPRRRRRSPERAVQPSRFCRCPSPAASCAPRRLVAALAPTDGRPAIRVPSGSGSPVIASRYERTCAASRAAELGPHLVLLAPRRDRLPQPVPAGQRRAPRRHQGRAALHARAAGRRTRKGLVALTGCRHGEIARRLLAGDREGAAARAAPSALSGRSVRRRAGSSWSSSTTCCPTTTGWWPRLARLADELGLPTVVTNDAHYARPEDRELQDVLVGIRHGQTLEESAHLRRPNGEYHLKGEAELRCPAAGRPDAGSAGAPAWAEGMADAGGARGAAARSSSEFEQYRFPGFPVPQRRDAPSASWSALPRGRAAALPPAQLDASSSSWRTSSRSSSAPASPSSSSSAGT